MTSLASRSRPLGPLAAALALLALSACKTTTTTSETVGPAEPARRAAQSFVHCVESEGGGCVRRDPKQGSWDAFSLLNWLGAGSPTSILRSLQRELEHHRDPLSIQDRLVVQAGRFREPLRGAECKPESAAPMTEVLPKLVARVQTRMEGLGLWRNDLAAVVDALKGEVEDGLSDGWLVHMTCYGDPYEIWVATALEEERQVVVGMLTMLPPWLGGHQPSEEVVEGRLRTRTPSSSTTLGVVREGTIDSNWLPLAVEEF
ncbi:hypothetical protein G6O69_12360 [Pseudenhygromyxa sp. WMMC2535]|uniref:hypothetical protein n=1 Tax=Pseudenhygromyxa sp. WMMC2535 TaxID=2712867 RepID=UPI001556FCA7|nr:hypothetical protein [Pseudenhygromyxa sp. WMMC2535]NVB38625.1 hypothetical protein [Pseudenhygromyxa sp. WMMC2535]